MSSRAILQREHNRLVALGIVQGGSNAPLKINGRPKKWASQADKQRAYRRRSRTVTKPQII